MNIFILDTNPVKCAQYHTDRHVVKMILEMAQMMAAVIRREIAPVDADEFGIYKSTHKNHPCTIWLGANNRNYSWGYDLLVALNSEYHHRYGKDHKSYLAAKEWPWPTELPSAEYRSSFAQAMPEEFKRENAVDAYRSYYKARKVLNASWKNRGKPDWVNSSEIDGGFNVTAA